MDSLPVQDKNVSLTRVFALGLWALAAALVLAELALGVDLADVGLLAGLAAATLTVRGYFVDLHDRERNAFEIGRDSARKVR